MTYINDVAQPVPANGGKPTLETLEAIEKKLGTAVSLYEHSITRGSGGPKVTITPATPQVVYIPHCRASSSTGNEQEESFSAATLGQWLPSCDYERPEGYVRPVFEVMCSTLAGSASTGPVVKPVNQTGRCPLYLFTNQKIQIPAHAWFALH